MKIKHIVLASSLLISVSVFAQKDELKTLKKIYGKEAPKPADVVEYKSTLAKLEGLATAEEDKVYAGFYKAMLPFVEIMSLGPTVTPVQKGQIVTAKTVVEIEKGLNATLDYEKKIGKKTFTDDIKSKIELYKNDILNLAITLGKQEKYQDATNVLRSLYLLDKKNQDNLFYAASYAINAKNYDQALEYYDELKKLNYSGESTIFWAVNKASKEEESFPDKANRDLFIKAGSHEKPRDEKTESRRGEIYKNIALIYVQQGKNKEAIAAIEEAKKVSPNDKSLAATEMDIYVRMNDFETYSKLVNEALAKDPNNADLIYNLGVISSNNNKLEDAEKYFKRAIEIDSNYLNAYVSLYAVLLKPDAKIVEEMNKLGTSDKDNKRYEVLKTQRQKLFTTIMPYLEKAHQLNPKDEEIKSNLKSVYNFLELTDKAKALKAEQ